MRVKVKICGVTNQSDARDAIEAGADAIGLNFVDGSPRKILDLDLAGELQKQIAERNALGVGVFAGLSVEEIVKIAEQVGLDAIQLHGGEPREFATAIRNRLRASIWKAYRVSTLSDLERVRHEDWPCDVLLLDSRAEKGGALGGTGTVFDWSILEGFEAPKPLALAGGLGPDNIARAILAVGPVWVDCASGVESGPGKKDRGKMEQFIRSAKGTS